MPPVTRRGYKNEFKHEVKSDPHSLQERRPRCLPPRPPQCQHPQQLFPFSKVFPLRFSIFLCLNIVANESAFYTFIINENRRYS